MLNIIRKYKEKKKADQLKLDEKKERDRIEAESWVESAKIAMFKKPCPINKNDSCYEGCAHFRSGSIYHWDFPLTGGQWVKTSPKCKLWKN